MENTGIKNRDRVKELGEVYTPDSIVMDMLNGVNKQLEDKGYSNIDIINETYLEPTCGNGQFLIRMIKDKIDRVYEAAKNGEIKEEDINKHLIRAVSTVYGIDIDKENVVDTKTRLLKLIFEGEIYTFDNKNGKGNQVGVDKYPKISLNKSVVDTLSEKEKLSIVNIINNNIIVGNMLDNSTEITSYEWSDDNSTVDVGIVTISELMDATEDGVVSKEKTFNYDNIEVHRRERIEFVDYTKNLEDFYKKQWEEYSKPKVVANTGSNASINKFI